MLADVLLNACIGAPQPAFVRVAAMLVSAVSTLRRDVGIAAYVLESASRRFWVSEGGKEGEIWGMNR